MARYARSLWKGINTRYVYRPGNDGKIRLHGCNGDQIRSPISFFPKRTGTRPRIKEHGDVNAASGWDGTDHLKSAFWFILMVMMVWLAGCAANVSSC